MLVLVFCGYDLRVMTTTEYKKTRKTIGTQSDVAELLGISERTIQSLESGARPILAGDEAALRGLVAVLPGATAPVVDVAIPGRRMDSTSKHESPDTLTANIIHWYVEPGYVLRRRDEKIGGGLN